MVKSSDLILVFGEAHVFWATPLVLFHMMFRIAVWKLGLWNQT